MLPPLRKLAIVGASARAAAFSAIRAGYQVVAADLFADADLARVADATRIAPYPDGLADWLAATPCDAWLYTGALENHPELVDRMAALRPLWGSAGAALRAVRDPLALQAALRDADIGLPETRPAADGLPLDGSWLCKTYRGASGSGVWLLDGAAARQRAETQQAVFQRRVPGEPYAAVFVARAGRAALLGVTRQLVGWNPARPFQYVGSIGPVELEPAVLREFDALGATLATRFALQGLVGVDFVLHDRRAWLVEVNPRYTASVEILERAAQRSAISLVANWCSAGPPPARPPGPGRPLLSTVSHVHGKAIVFAPAAVPISESFARWTAEQTADALADPPLADLPRAGDEVLAGGPLLTVFASAPSVQQCDAQLRQRVAMVEWRPYAVGR